MAEEAKRLGFTALVLTDHYYGEEYSHCGLVRAKLESYTKAIQEAQQILPVIRGIEIPFGGEEILVFGTTALTTIFKFGGITSTQMLSNLRKHHYCAMILCHPGENYPDFIEHIDGYERHNSGDDQFSNRELNGLEKLQAWHNSDAHAAVALSWCHNIVDTKITTEDHLIKYIKSGKTHKYKMDMTYD